MLAVAVSGSHSGAGKTSFGTALLKEFPGFSAVKVTSDDNLKECEIRLCEKKEDSDTGKDTDRYLKVADSVWWLLGPRGKLRKVIHQLLTPDKAPKCVLVEGNSVSLHLPWAIQIFIASSPIEAWKPSALTSLKHADVVILNIRSNEQNIIPFLQEKVKEINPCVPVMTENLEQGLSTSLKHFLGNLFEVYCRQVEQIKDALEVYLEKRISCQEARGIAADLQVSVSLVGRICQEEGIKISQCELGCF